MTPSDPGSAGELHVSVTGDITNLLSALNEAQSASAHAGQGISSALTSGASEASAALSSIAAPAHAAAEGVHEAESAFGMLSEILIEVAGVLGIAVGLEEIGREALQAYSKVQDLTTAFTLMTGSAEKAGEQVEALKGMSQTLAVPFEQLASAAQRLSLDLGGFDNASVALRNAADAAALSGRSFETVAQSIDRMALSGTASSRMLVSLGININTLGEAMDVTGDKAAKAFKALDVQDRLEVLDTAMAKVSGGAEAMAQNLSGQWTNFRNDVEFNVEEIGHALAPLASELMSAFDGLLSSLQGIVAPLAELAASTVAEALHEMGTAAHEFGQALTLIDISAITSEFAGLSAEIGRLTGMNLSGFFKQAAADAFNAATHLRDFSDILKLISSGIEAATGKSAAMNEAISKMLTALAPVPPKMTETGESAQEFSKGLQSIIDKHGELTEAVKKAKAVLDEAADDLKSHKISQDEYNAALAAYNKTLTELHPKIQQHADDFKVLDAAMADLAKVPMTLENAMNEMASGVNLETLKTKIQGMIDKIRELSGVGTAETDQIVSALANAVDKLNGFATSGASAIEKIINAQKKADEAAAENKIALDALTLSYQNQIPLLNGHIATLAEVDRAQKMVNSSTAAAADGVKAVGEAAASSAPKMIDVGAALKGIASASDDVAAKALLSSQNFDEGAKVIVDGAMRIVPRIDDVTTSMGTVVETSDKLGNSVPGEFVAVGNAAMTAASSVHAVAAAAQELVQVDLHGYLESASQALDDVNAKALAELDIWGQIAAATAQATEAVTKYAGASKGLGGSKGGGIPGGGDGSGLSMSQQQGAFGDASAGFGDISGTVSGLAMIAYAAAFHFGIMSSILQSETDAAMIAAGMVVVGNNMYESAQELANSTHAIGQIGKGISAAFSTWTDIAGKVHGATENFVDTTNKVASTINLMDPPLHTLQMHIDSAGNAIYDVVPSIEGLGHSVYNVNAHLEDLVKGVTSADVAFGGAVTFASAIAQATTVVGAAAQVAAAAAGVALSAIPRQAGAMSVPTPFLPSIPGFAVPQVGAANSSTIGQTQSPYILITGNAITSQDSAQKLAATMVAALRNNAGLKL